MPRINTIGILLALVIAVAACGGGEAAKPAEVSDTAQTMATDFSDRAMPLSMKLPVGTLMLEETPLAVTPAQAQELLPMWQMLRALQESGTAAQLETEAVLDQIQAAMTPEQLAAIEELSPEDTRDLFQELGMRSQGTSDSTEEGGFRPPDMGMMPPGAGDGRQRGMGPGMGPGGFGDFSPEERATVMAGRGGMGMGFATGMADRVIELLEMRAAES